MKARSVKFLSAAALVLGSLGVASAAHARSDVFFSVGVQAPGVYVEPAPVYVQPRPVYIAPSSAYIDSRPVYVTPRVEYRDAGEWRGRQGWRHWEERRHVRVNAAYGDRDHDGVANRFDRFPGNPYRY
jgi:hypothetical protein